MNSSNQNFSETRSENILGGIVGACIFSLGGCLLYFLVYQLGYIAAICGIVTYVLAVFGYQLFSGRKETAKGMIISLVITLLALALAEYLCLAYEVYDAYHLDYDINFFDAFNAVPSFLTDPEYADLRSGVISDVLFSYLLGGISFLQYIYRNHRNKKAAAKKRSMPAPTTTTSLSDSFAEDAINHPTRTTLDE
ncbi:MAG: hypothetical protein KA965_09170 [Butyrivibrio sp.]|nr:hypothetical protein [Butyrivibrio sp.]